MDWGHLVRAGLGIPDYWHPRLRLQPGFLHGELQLYPFTMDVKANYPGQLDSHGIPILYWGPDRGPHPSPVNIILYGLGNHEAYLKTGDEKHRERMYDVLRWMAASAVPAGKGVGWPFPIDLPSHRVKAPWFSGITQGFALSLVLRAWRMQMRGPWAELATDTWRSFDLSAESGGFKRVFSDGVIYEEYPGPELDCVFNGACHALIGLWEAWRCGLIPGAERDFRLGMRGLAQLLPRFARGRWSLYSLSPYVKRPLLASPYYHCANGLLSSILGEMTGDAAFRCYGSTWVSSSRSLPRRVAVSLRIGTERFLFAKGFLNHDKTKPRA